MPSTRVLPRRVRPSPCCQPPPPHVGLPLELQAKISRAFVDGEPVGSLTREHRLQNHAVPADGAPAPRPPGRTGSSDRLWRPRVAGEARPAVAVPVGATTFRGRALRRPAQ